VSGPLSVHYGGWVVRGGGVTRHGWHQNSHKAANYMSDHNSYCWCYNSKTVITTAMLQSQQHLPTSHKSCWRHYNSNLDITTASSAHKQQGPGMFTTATATIATALQSHCHRNSNFTPQSLSQQQLAPSQQQSPGST
jgi:hypothetical protein